MQEWKKISAVDESQFIIFKDKDRNKNSVAFNNLTDNSAISRFWQLLKTTNECTGKLLLKA